MAGIVLLELIDEPAGIIDPDVELVAGSAEKGAGELAQLPGGCAGEAGKLAAALPVDEALLEVDADGGVGALEKALDFTEESRQEVRGKKLEVRSDGR